MQQKKNIYIKLGILILLIALFSIFMFRSCKRARAEEVEAEDPIYSIMNLYSGDTLIDNEPLEPLMNIHTGIYKDLGKTLILANNLENNNQLYTIEIIFQSSSPIGYNSSSFNWIASFREIPSVSNEITLYYETGSGSESSVTWYPADYYGSNNDTRTMLIQHHVYVSGTTSEFGTRIIKLVYNINPGTNFYLTFKDTSYSTYSVGYDAGYNDGYENGKLAIDSVSYQNGYNTGWDKGRTSGERYGYQRGYEEGYIDGYNQLIEDEQITTTINFNQLIPTTAFNNISGDFTLVNNSDGSYTLNGTTTTNITSNVYTLSWNTGHIMAFGIIDTVIDGVSIRENNAGVSTNTFRLYNRNQNYTSFVINIQANKTFNNVKIYPQLFDLTQIYGEGNEPSSIETFKNDFPSIYYPYTTSEIINISYNDGFNNGYLEGEYKGIIEGETHVIEQTNFIEVVFNSIDAFLNIRLLPHVTIGIIVFIPLMISMAWFVIKAFRGGGE